MSRDSEDAAPGVNRRSFMGAATIGAGAAVAAGLSAPAEAEAEVLFPSARGTFGGGGSAGGAVYRSENDLYDCEVEGKLPADLDGIFFRVGPDPQYPKAPQYQSDIAFDGEGHVCSFRFQNGHVDFKSRYVRNQRWKAQHAARKSLFGMYRNATTDDPSVKGLSRGTANTQIFYHHGKLLALKEDSPPVAMDPLTLETTDDYYLFAGKKYEGQTHTAHPKIDSHTGELIGFGYEAKGLGTKDLYVYSADPKGRINWSAWIQVPYAGMIHDFGVTEKHIMFFVIPMATSLDNIREGKVHFAWDSSLPCYVGVLPRGADGKDIRWFKGPQYMCTHTMGNWTDGQKVYFDQDGGEGNQFPFFPSRNPADPFVPAKSAGRVRRFVMDLSKTGDTPYEVETMYPQITGALARQDDRYHTVPYRYGFLNGRDNTTGAAGWACFDHQTKSAKVFSLGPDTRLQEMCFVPRKKGAPEGDGYLIGVASRTKENGRSDLVLVDAKHIEDGPIATVKLPYRIPDQVHGFWAPGDQLPKPKAAKTRA